MGRKWTVEQLKQAVLESKSYRETCRRLGLIGGGNHISKKCKELGIDTSHFTPKPVKGKSSYFKYIGETIWNLKIYDVYRGKEYTKGKGEYSFICECLKCGKKDNIKSCSQVIRGSIKTCGCRKDQYASYRGKNNKGWTGCGEISGTMFKNYRLKAKKRNIEFKITIEYLWDLFLKQDRKCALTGLDLKLGVVDNKQSKTASIDRIDSSKGYIEGNIQWVHKKINIMKSNYTQEDFIQLCKLVARNNND